MTIATVTVIVIVTEAFILRLLLEAEDYRTDQISLFPDVHVQIQPRTFSLDVKMHLSYAAV